MTPEQFKQTRNNLGLTLLELSEILGVNPRAIRRWEAEPSVKSSRPPNPTACNVLKWLISGELQLKETP